MLASPTAFSQTYDNLFHLNAIRWIIDHGNASSLAFKMTSGDGPTSFYPTAWHDLVSVSLLSMGSTDVARGNNAAIIVVLALVWPLACLSLVRVMLQPSVTAVLATGVLVASVGAFPYLLLGFGVLYPNFLGLAVLPAVLALALSFVGLGYGERFSLFSTLSIGLVGMAGIALAHPNVALTMVAVVAPVLAVAWSARGVLEVKRGTLGRALLIARVLTVVALLVVAWVLFQTLHAPYESLWWPVSRSNSDAIGEALLLAPRDTPVPVFTALLAMTGVYAVIRTGRHWWLLGCHLAFVFLWTVVSASTDPIFRNFFGAPWYNDTFRLASLLAITGISLAVVGFEFVLGRALGAMTANGSAEHPQWWASIVVALSVVVLLAATQVGNKQGMIDWVRGTYLVTPDAALVDTDEYTVLLKVSEIVPPTEVIAVNPWNGSSMAYALTGRPTTFTHVQYAPDPTKEVLTARLSKAATDAEVCKALHTLRVKWVLDFGNTRLINNEQRGFPGFEGLRTSPGFEVRAESGHAALYEITACGL